MRLLLFLVLSAALTGCTQTRVWSPSGVEVVRSSGNSKGMGYTCKEFTWTAPEIDHATASLARGKAVSDRMTAAGAAVAASGIAALF